MNKINRKQLSFLRIILRIFKIVLKTNPLAFFSVVIISVIYALCILGTMVYLQKFLDSVEGYIFKQNSLEGLIFFFLIYGGLLIGAEVMNSILNLTGEYIGQKCNGIFSRHLNKKLYHIEPIFFEDPDRLNELEKANAGKSSVTFTLMLSIMVIFFYGVYLIGVSYYLITLKPIFVLSVFLVFVPLLINFLLRSKWFSQLVDESAPYQRELNHYQDCLTGRRYYKETRLLGAVPFFTKKFREVLSILNLKAWRTDFKATRNELLMRLISLVGYGVLLTLLIDAAVKGEISIGAFAAIFASIAGVMELIEELLNQQIKTIFQSIGPSRNYFQVLDWPERNGTEAFNGIHRHIELKDVHFRYPNANQDALQNINLSIKKGETIAIVGENGSGKSTMSKVMLGLYLPTEGSIFYDEKPTSNLSFSTIFNYHSAVFQSYLKVGLSLEENIRLSEWYSSAQVESSLEEAGLDLNIGSFPQGKDTVLSREFGGVDLSGGQWQRVAIARGLYRDHNIIVLDEPTAAIDPLEEQRVFEQFMQISKDKTAILVTHRLGSARIADRIVVMEHGQIVEIGTHVELIALDGKYSQMYRAQADWYVRET